MRTHFRLVAVLILCAGLSASRISQGQGASGALKLGEAAPEFALANIEGKRVRLKDYRGKRHVALVFYPALFRSGG